MMSRRPTSVDMCRLVVAVAFGLTGLTACGAGEPDLVATVSGIVEQGPTCPLETLASPCPPAPAVGVRVDVRQGGAVVASTTTDADGRFRLTAPAGLVEVRATSTEGLPSEDVKTFTLQAGDDVEARLLLDTGIR